ncbi:synaptonemal complex protein 1 [Megalops cyprinoides]|uniref:synaptonemal complex protein 1 n=1 Tax=Megalops cyprinoides TaxID=118141 RepID=UPI0018642478|nr:synaptonemal complex protein 1 [Megalops cyprinoides]
MERERAFNFKLLVPPRISSGQVSAVKPQEITEDSCGFIQPVRTLSKSFDKEAIMPFPATTMVMPSKSTRTDGAKKIAVTPMEKEETPLRSSQLYSKLFEEAEKIKNWKVKMDLDIAQKERKLQESRRTIENQRKAIQELQFGNESLSMKLEEEISKNTDLKNKSNATRNLCNLLKETFERSTERMGLYDSEREETHQLFLQNNANIQRMINAFEDLRVQAETDRHELLKQQHQEMLENTKQEQELLLEKLQSLEQANKESEENSKALEAALESKEEEYSKALAEKDENLEELNKIREEQTEKLQEILATSQELQTSLTFEMQKSNTLCETEERLSVALANEGKSAEEIERLKEEIERDRKTYKELEESFRGLQLQKEAISHEAQARTSETEKLQAHLKESKANEKRIMKEMERVEVEKQQLRDDLESLKTKTEEQGEEMENMHKRHEESNRSLQSELMKKDKNIRALEIKMNTLKTKMENKTKSHEECLKEVNELKEEFKNVQALHDEELKQLHQEIETKRIVEAELHAKVQQLQLTAAEAVRSKEDIEMKCQHKISDMVALMDKHKNQYDKMVEEKDAELDERRRKEADIKAEKTSLELELSELKIENSHLKQELENGLKDKSYRIRTPPSPGKSVLLGRNALELDPKSESSEQHDTLSFTVEPDSFEQHLTPCVSGTVHQHGIQHKMLQSPAVSKSPGTALKLAAVKRMRDAGWTAVTNADKRKKGATEKIFA